MTRKICFGLLSALCFFSAPLSASGPTKLEVAALIEANQQAKRTGAQEDIERFVSLLAEDVVDEHVNYGVTFSGRDFFRENIPGKAQSIVDLSYELDRIILGQSMAVVSYDYRSVEKSGEETMSYTGTWILTLEYDENGLVSRIRRFRG